MLNLPSAQDPRRRLKGDEMPLQIALAWSPECKAELIQKGFKKREVFIREYLGAISTEAGCKLGDGDFFGMKHSPYQFVTTSYWGAGPD